MADTGDIDLYADVEAEFQQDDFSNTDNNDLYDDVITAGSKDDAKKKEPSVGKSPSDKGISPARTPQSSFSSHGSNDRRYQIYIGNLTWWTTDQDIQDAIQGLGINDFKEVKFHENRANGQSKGFCCVTLGSDSSTRKVMDILPKKEIHSQNPVVTFATKQALNQFESQSKTRPPSGQSSTNGGMGSRGGPAPPQVGGGMRGPPPSVVAPPPGMNRPPPGLPPPAFRPSGPPPSRAATTLPPVVGAPPPSVLPPPVSGPPPTMRGPPLVGQQPPPTLPPPHGLPPPVLGAPPPTAVRGVPPVMAPHSGPPPVAGAHVNPAFFPPGTTVAMPGASAAPPPAVVYRDAPVVGASALHHHGLSEPDFEEIMSRNRTVSSSAIARAVQDAANGEYASAIETLVTAVSLIKQSKVAGDDRCKILISSLQDTLHGIESKSYGARGSGGGSSGHHHHHHHSRSPPDHRRMRSYSRHHSPPSDRYRERSPRYDERYRERSRSRERDYRREKEYYEEQRYARERERERERDRPPRDDRDRDRERDMRERERGGDPSIRIKDEGRERERGGGRQDDRMVEREPRERR